MTESEEELLTDADIAAFQRQIVDATIEKALELAKLRNFDVGHVFPSVVVGIQNHPALFSARVYDSLVTALTEAAKQRKYLRYEHMYRGSTMCDFQVHAMQP